ncbi:hypothetical protein CRM22_007922 [Opisthorchis felineus]|uniref:DH domain-containing protein n=1 Tax=Opisthorchis felineus TaxID=147828 RepID=A0A4S2LDL0_OPIFE|nr:hypothetical protein CRM22_007922 [Opisthorchis felineus]
MPNSVSMTLDSGIPQTLGMSTPYSVAWDKLEQLKRTKTHLLDELIVSEIKYVRFLRKILLYFAEPMSERELLPSSMHGEIFGRLQPILSVSETLLESILTMGIDEAFLLIAPCLKLYADYSRRYQTVLVLLETCIALSPDLHRFISQQESLPEVDLQLSALLIMPIQRIPRYSLMLQELLMICLQMDGLNNTKAVSCIEKLSSVVQERHIIPEQVCTHILRMYDCIQSRQPLPEDSELASGLVFLGHFMPSLRFATVKLMAAFASIAATATYLNEQIRINSQADMAAILQSKLLGNRTENLLLVPGRRLLRYGLVYKRNELTGRLHSRLLVLMSDILIYATPRKVYRRSGKFVTVPASTKKSSDLRCSQPMYSTRYRRVRINRFAFLRARTKRLIAGRLAEKAWLNSITCPSSPSSTHPKDILANRNLRFSCVSVYPLHHCQIEPHFTPSMPTDQTFILSRVTRLTSILECSPSPIKSTSSQSKDLLAHSEETNNSERIAKFNGPNADKGDSNAFTIRCRDASFTVVLDKRDLAEDWVVNLENALRAVKLARQSLRKASSAKRPMQVSDFVRYEQWLASREAQTRPDPDYVLPHAVRVAESLGLYTDSALSNLRQPHISDPTRGISNSLGKLTCGLRLLSPFRSGRRYFMSDPTQFRSVPTSPSWQTEDCQISSNVQLVSVDDADENSDPLRTTTRTTPTLLYRTFSLQTVHNASDSTEHVTYSPPLLPLWRKRLRVRDGSGAYANVLNISNDSNLRSSLTEKRFSCHLSGCRSM